MYVRSRAARVGVTDSRSVRHVTKGAKSAKGAADHKWDVGRPSAAILQTDSRHFQRERRERSWRMLLASEATDARSVRHDFEGIKEAKGAAPC